MFNEVASLSALFLPRIEDPQNPPSRCGTDKWGRLAHKVKLERRDGGESFYLYNTHYEHLHTNGTKSQQEKARNYRIESSRRIRQDIEQTGEGEHIIVAGDYNSLKNQTDGSNTTPPELAQFESEEYMLENGHTDLGDHILRDLLCDEQSDPACLAGTYLSVKAMVDGRPTAVAAVDYLFGSKHISCRNSAVDSGVWANYSRVLHIASQQNYIQLASKNGTYPSDHRLLYCELHWP